VLFGKKGWLGAWLARWNIELVFSWQGAVVAATVVAFPLVLKGARAAFEEVDQRLEHSGLLLGVSRTAVFFRITLPLALRGIMAGTLLAFARALGEFGATLMIAGSIPGQTQSLSTAMNEVVQMVDDAVVGVLVTTTAAVCIIFLWSALLLARRHVRATQEGYLS